MTARKKLSPTARAIVFRDNGGVCYLCGRKVAPGEDWQVEHPLAVALNGPQDLASLKVVHVDCHKPKTAEDIRRIRKADRNAKRAAGIKKRSRMPGSKDSRWRKKVNGEVVAR